MEKNQRRPPGDRRDCSCQQRTQVCAGKLGDGEFLIIYAGPSWSVVNDGLTNLNILSRAVCRADLLCGTLAWGVWRRPLTEMTSVNSSLYRRRSYCYSVDPYDWIT